MEYFASQITELEENEDPNKYEVLILMEYSAGMYRFTFACIWFGVTYGIWFLSGGEVVDMMNKRMGNRMNESEILHIFADVCEVSCQMQGRNTMHIHELKSGDCDPGSTMDAFL